MKMTDSSNWYKIPGDTFRGGIYKFILQDLFPYLISTPFLCILIMFTSVFVFWLQDMAVTGYTWLCHLHDFTLIYSIQLQQGGQKVVRVQLKGG